MRKVFGLAAMGLIAAIVTLAAPATSNAQVVVSPGAVVTTAPVASYRVHRHHHRSHCRRGARRGHRVYGRPSYHRYHHTRQWRR